MGEWRGAAESAEEYGVLAALEVMMPMRDGVRLATDLYFPAQPDDPGVRVDGRHPVLLVRTPYNKRNDDTRIGAEYFTRRGYVVAIQDCRGRYRSEGTFYFLTQEPEDGYDTIEWLGAQPWSTGKVGMFGTSYLGWTQTAAAVLNPPSLATMVVNQAGANAYTSSVRQNGAMELRFLAWAFMEAATHPEVVNDPVRKAALQSVSSLEWLQHLPLRPGLSPLALVPSVERWALDLYTNGDYTEYWDHPGLNFAKYWDEHADVPLLLCGAWYDSYTRATLENFAGLGERKRGPVRLLMGPWTHSMVDVSYAGDVELGPTAPVAGNLGEEFLHLHLRWFDHWLKGIDNGVGEEPAARLFVMGDGDGETRRTHDGRLWRGGHWIDADALPLPGTTQTDYYLLPDGGLGTIAGTGTASTTFRYDPTNPVPTVGGNLSSLSDAIAVDGDERGRISYEQRWNSVVSIGGQDQRDPETGMPLAARDDVVVFQTEPLAEPVQVIGALEATLYISSSAPDTDFTVKLVDVFPPSEDYPHGYALNLSDTIFRCRYRDDPANPTLMEPGQVYELTIPMYGTGAVFGRGHRIRVDISSSNFPRFDPNPNTGEPIGRHHRSQVAENTIHHDAAHPSRITLPVVE
ncbi:MAG: CocE/NonD family hydrolase [Thermomicrobiales bacterium]|nr:CocE/NonD family hydrolase [Thermomicrobiales bacterium]